MCKRIILISPKDTQDSNLIIIKDFFSETEIERIIIDENDYCKISLNDYNEICFKTKTSANPVLQIKFI